MTQAEDRFGLVAAVAARRRHLPIRLLSAVMFAVGLHMLLDWWAIWAWAGVYFLVQLAEGPLAARLLRKRPETPAAAANMAVMLFFPAAIVNGGLSLPLWAHAGVYGPALAVTLIAAGMTNLIMLNRGCRIGFAASATPYGLYLLALPLLDVGRVAGPMLTVMTSVVALFMLNTIGAWISTEEARRLQEEATAEAERRRAEAEAAVASKSAYIAAISHELRTPISAILAGAADLERSVPGHRRAQARLISTAGQMMRALLDDLLDLSKIEAGRMQVESLPYDLRSTLNEVLRMWRPQALEKALRLRVEGAASLPRWVLGDPTRLRQVLNNLLSNAIKFTASGSVTLRARVAATADGGLSLALAVIDTGPGMTGEQVTRLFTPFEQLDAGVARQHGGSGLGLAISHELARLMGGGLTVTSAPGEGSTFTLSLTTRTAEAPAPAAAPSLGEARILVVDDHAVNRQAIGLILGAVGVVPEMAASAEEALERLAIEPFDVVLMDVYMPDMDGRDATRRLRESEGPNRMTPVIAITASDTARDWEACRVAGMNGQAPKPIQPVRLYAVIESVLGEAAVRRSAAA